MRMQNYSIQKRRFFLQNPIKECKKKRNYGKIMENRSVTWYMYKYAFVKNQVIYNLWNIIRTCIRDLTD